MAPPSKPISLSDIHNVYRGSVKKPEEPAGAEQKYKKTDRFAREAGHNGSAPQRTLSPPGRRVR